jgi:hypothetical protein
MIQHLKPKNPIIHLHDKVEQIDFTNLEKGKVHYFANVQPYPDDPISPDAAKVMIAEYLDLYYERQAEYHTRYYNFNFPFAIGYLKQAERDKLYRHGINHFWRAPGLGPLLAGGFISGTEIHLQEVLLLGTFLHEFRKSLQSNQDLYDMLFRVGSDRMVGEYALEHYAQRIIHEFEIRRWIPFGQKCSTGFADQLEFGRGIFYKTQNMHVHMVWDWRKKTFYVHSFGETWPLLRDIVTTEQIGESEIIMGDPVARAMELTEKFGPDIVVLPHHVGGYSKLIVEFKFVVKGELQNEQTL